MLSTARFNQALLVAGSARRLALEAARELIPAEAPYREEASALLTAIGNRG